MSLIDSISFCRNESRSSMISSSLLQGAEEGGEGWEGWEGGEGGEGGGGGGDKVSHAVLCSIINSKSLPFFQVTMFSLQNRVLAVDIPLMKY